MRSSTPHTSTFFSVFAFFIFVPVSAGTEIVRGIKWSSSASTKKKEKEESEREIHEPERNLFRRARCAEFKSASGAPKWRPSFVSCAKVCVYGCVWETVEVYHQLLSMRHHANSRAQRVSSCVSEIHVRKTPILTFFCMSWSQYKHLRKTSYHFSRNLVIWSWSTLASKRYP